MTITATYLDAAMTVVIAILEPGDHLASEHVQAEHAVAGYTIPQQVVDGATVPARDVAGYTIPAGSPRPITIPVRDDNPVWLALKTLVDAGTVELKPYAEPPVDLVAYAEAARYAKETGGITVNGVPIATTDRSKLLIAGARLRAEDNPNGVEAFDAADGKQYEMPSAGIVRISKAVGEHVSRVFKVCANIKSHLAQTPPGISTTAEIDAAFAAVVTAY